MGKTMVTGLGTRAAGHAVLCAPLWQEVPGWKQLNPP